MKKDDIIYKTVRLLSKSGPAFSATWSVPFLRQASFRSGDAARGSPAGRSSLRIGNKGEARLGSTLQARLDGRQKLFGNAEGEQPGVTFLRHSLPAESHGQQLRRYSHFEGVN